MASVIKRKGKNTWYASWKQNGRSVIKSTMIDIKQPGLTEKKTRQPASTVAEAMELPLAPERERERTYW